MIVGRKVENPVFRSQPPPTQAFRQTLTVEHGIHAKLRHAKHPDLPVLEGLPHVLAAELLRAARVAVLPPPPLHHQPLLLVAQEARTRSIIRQQKERHDTKHNRRQALDNHNPSPPAQPSHALHVPDTVRQQPAQPARDGGADEEIPHAQRELVLAVEEGEVDVQPGEEAGLDGAEEQAARDEGAVGVDQPREGGDDAPGDGDEGDPAGGREELEDEVGGDLEDDVGHEEDGDGDLELVSLEVEVGLEVVEACVADIDAVGVREWWMRARDGALTGLGNSRGRGASRGE